MDAAVNIGCVSVWGCLGKTPKDADRVGQHRSGVTPAAAVVAAAAQEVAVVFATCSSRKQAGLGPFLEHLLQLLLPLPKRSLGCVHPQHTHSTPGCTHYIELGHTSAQPAA
jgi:hypothetical protein